MIDKQIIKVRDMIKKFLPREEKGTLAEFGWGEYEKLPGKQGLIEVGGGFYTYIVSDRGGTTFMGPIAPEHLLDYVSGDVFGIEIPGRNPDDAIISSITDTMFSCELEELEKKVSEEK